jgi:Holliday junction resolvase RusA-like endonuclease
MGRTSGDGDGRVTLSFRVLGVPVPQGSKKGYVVGGRAVLVESNKALMPWRDSVAAAALEAHQGGPMEGALHCDLHFRMPRPKTARKSMVFHATRPDLDKLTRAVFDALTISGVIRDDAQIASLFVDKTLALQHDPWTGCTVDLRPLIEVRPQTDLAVNGRLL